MTRRWDDEQPTARAERVPRAAAAARAAGPGVFAARRRLRGIVSASLVLAASNNGKELWYLTRGSGAVALLLLTASVVLGVANTTRWKTDRWPRFLVYGLHRNVTLLALAFTAIHVATTIVDATIGVVDAFIRSCRRTGRSGSGSAPSPSTSCSP